MMDGCVLGKLSKAGTDTNYFYGVTQPFYFVADSSADSGVVSIRVGVIDMNPQNRILNNNNPIENDNPVSCANLDFIENLYINANLVVGNLCQSLPKCTENNAGKKPDIEVLDLPNGYFGVDLCLDPEIIKRVEDGKSVLGGYHEPCWSKSGEWIIFLPQYWLFIRTPDRQIYNDFSIELCYDNIANVVQFGIEDDKLYFKSIVGFCENLIDLTNYTMINDTSELRTKVPQNAQSLLLVFNALEVCRTYGKNPGSYYFSEITWAHELQHKENFKTQIVKHCNDNFDYLNYSRFDISCEDAININSVKHDMKQNYKESLEDFEKEVRSLYFNKFGGNNREWNETTNTHNRTSVTNVIDKYQDKVSDLLWELIENKN